MAVPGCRSCGSNAFGLMCAGSAALALLKTSSFESDGDRLGDDADGDEALAAAS